VNENVGSGNATVTVTRTGGTAGVLTANYAVATGRRHGDAGSDYTTPAARSPSATARAARRSPSRSPTTRSTRTTRPSTSCSAAPRRAGRRRPR
jgi:hypothetical protein